MAELPTAKHSFVLLPRRWVVERSFVWLARCCRLARDYERLAETLVGLHFVACARLMTSRCVAFMAQSSWQPLKNYIGTSSNSRTARSANAVRCVRNAIIRPAATMPGFFKIKAEQLDKTFCQVKTDLLRDYLRAELRNPRIPAFRPV